MRDTGAISEFGSSYDHGKILYAMIDGETTYCLNYAKSASNGQYMISYSNSSTSLTSEQKSYLKYCMYYGFRTSNTSGPSDSQKNKYIATQAMVWIIEKEVFNTSSATSAAKKLCASAPDSSESYNYYVSLKEKMLEALEAKQPSFSESTKTSAKTYELDWSEENNRYEVTLSDTNKSLANYNVSLDDYKISRSGNKLTIYSKSSISGTNIGTLTANDGTIKITGNCVFWRVSGGSSSYQEFVSGVPESEKVSAYFKVKTNAIGYGEIVKKDSSTGTVLQGAVYGIYGDKSCTSLIEKLTTDKKGYAKSSALDVGTYYVKEIKAPANYVLSATVYTLSVKADTTTALTVKDKGQKVKTEKLEEDGRESTQKVLLIKVTLKTYRDMIEDYKFTEEEINLFETLMSPEYLSLLGATSGGGSEGEFSNEQFEAVISGLADKDIKTVLNFALSKLDYPYSQPYRDSGKYYDCSSLMYYSWLTVGVNLSYEGANTAAQQAKLCNDLGYTVSYEEMQPGDLIFYSFGYNGRYKNVGHVAMYCGNGMLVDASYSKQKVVYRQVYSRDNIVLIGRPKGK